MPGSPTASPGAKPRDTASKRGGVYAGVVLYDASGKSAEALTFGFEREDFEVFATDKAEDALSLLEVSNAPVLAVSVGEDPAARAEALSFIGELHDKGPKRALAVVVLGRRDLREDALRAGADEFIAWPAFIRDAVTLARLAIASRPDGGGVSGLIEDYEVYFLVRALAAAGRSAVVDLERSGHKGQLLFARGELVAARAGRLTGVPAFHHLLLWGEATLKLRFSSPPGERKIHAPIDDLLQSGVKFVDEFEKLAQRVGGPQATFEKRPEKFSDPTLKVPPEVRKFAEALVSGATLVDIVESSPFKPFDTIKVCFRLCELGLVARRDPVRSISPLTAQLAVRDWLLGTSSAEQRSTVTEAGRRAAEAYAEAAARRVEESRESDDLFGDERTIAVERLEPEPVAAVAAPAEPEYEPETSDLATTMVEALPARIHDLPTAPRYETFADVQTDPQLPQLEPATVVELVVPVVPIIPVVSAAPVVAPPIVATPLAVPSVVVEPEPVTRPLSVLDRLPRHEAPKPSVVEENHFDDVDEAFFAKESDLHRVEAVDTFDDLDQSMRHQKLAPKKKWSLFGGSSTPAPAKKPEPKPRKRR